MRTAAIVAVSVAAVGATETTARVWLSGTTTSRTAGAAIWASALSVPLIIRQVSVAHSSTAHEGVKPEWAVLLLRYKSN